jgi:DNA-binding NtrC family response regulator
MPAPRVLIVDDERFVLENLKRVLSDYFNTYSRIEMPQVDVAADASDVARRIRTEKGEFPFDVILADVFMPSPHGTVDDGLHGAVLIYKALRDVGLHRKLVIITKDRYAAAAVVAPILREQRGSPRPWVIFQVKPRLKNSPNDQKLMELHFWLRTMKEAILGYDKPEWEAWRNLPGMTAIGGSSAYSDTLRSQVFALGSDPALYLIALLGASGTGKALVARALHDVWHHGLAAPFVKVNCPSIPETLVQTALFGTARGAFTTSQGASGFVETAATGTLFLDEFGSSSDGALWQTWDAACRQLFDPDDRHYNCIGTTRRTRFAGRIIIASSSLDVVLRSSPDLRSRIQRQIQIKPLRDRPDDIRYLAQLFLERRVTELNRRVSLGDDALDLLVRQRWPGNTRDLEKVIGKAVDEATAPTVDATSIASVLSSLGLDDVGEVPPTVERADRRMVNERPPVNAEQLYEALSRTDGYMAPAGKLLWPAATGRQGRDLIRALLMAYPNVVERLALNGVTVGRDGRPRRPTKAAGQLPSK